ncbi:MAG: helix-turn-helix domain-containing protein, partial [Candidatus Methylomirabilis sp.]|nr:helix-turn-helix domain-containing protein [Deltaproteobacteria bacterium]
MRVRRELDAGLDPLLNEQEAAERLGVAVKTLRRVRWDGSWPLPFVKLANGAVRYRWSAIERFLATGSRSSTSDPGPEGG